MSHNRMNAPAESLVWSVLKTKCPVSDACVAFSAVSRSRISPTSTHVRVVTQDASQAGGKCQADLWVHLNLIDALKLVLDGVFGGNDFVFFVLDLGQCAVQRGRLSRTRWTGNENDPSGASESAFESVGRCPRTYRFPSSEKFKCSLSNTRMDDAFAMQHGNHRDADVDFPALDAKLDAPILWHPLLCDVQLGHDF